MLHRRTPEKYIGAREATFGLTLTTERVILIYVSCCFVIIHYFFLPNGGLLIVDFGVNATKRTLLRNLSICGAGATNTDTAKHCHIAFKSTMTALVSIVAEKRFNGNQHAITPRAIQLYLFTLYL